MGGRMEYLAVGIILDAFVLDMPHEVFRFFPDELVILFYIRISTM